MSRTTTGSTHDGSEPSVTFRDGLGDRFLTRATETGDAVERLRVSADLAAQERALSERVDRLLNFRNVRFPRVHQVQSETIDGSKVVWVVSEHVPGTRLSELLAFVQSHEALVVDVNMALQVGREVLSALAVLHDSRGVTHGALGLERLILTPQGRVILADYALGGAFEKLQMARTRLWRDFRIAMPPSAGLPRFDRRSDVANLAVAVLMLLSGRPLGPGDSLDGLRKLLDGAGERLPNGRLRPLSSSLKGWLERALPIESRRPFATALEAQVALEDVLKKERAYAPTPAALKSFLQRYAAVGEAPALAAGDAQGPPRAAPLAAEPGSAPAPAAPRTHARRERHAPRTPVVASRLTPEQEEADEIRTLEAELARLARLEATAAVPPSAAPDPSPSVPVADAPEQVAEPAPGGDVIGQVEMPLAAGTPAGAAAQALASSPPEPAGGTTTALPLPEPVPASSAGTGPFDELVAEVVEVEILSADSQLPVLDVADLPDAARSIAFATDLPQDAHLVTPAEVPVGSTRDEELAELERVLREMESSEPVGPPAWMLTPPGLDAGCVATGSADDPAPPQRCAATAPLDFETPVYIRSLMARGAVSPDLALVARPVARDDMRRIQIFAAIGARSPREATSPLRRSRRRRAIEGVAHVRALPERTAPVVAALATRVERRMDVLLRHAASGWAGPLRLVTEPTALPATASPPRMVAAAVSAAAPAGGVVIDGALQRLLADLETRSLADPAAAARVEARTESPAPGVSASVEPGVAKPPAARERVPARKAKGGPAEAVGSKRAAPDVAAAVEAELAQLERRGPAAEPPKAVEALPPGGDVVARPIPHPATVAPAPAQQAAAVATARVAETPSRTSPPAASPPAVSQPAALQPAAPQPVAKPPSPLVSPLTAASPLPAVARTQQPERDRPAPSGTFFTDTTEAAATTTRERPPLEHVPWRVPAAAAAVQPAADAAAEPAPIERALDPWNVEAEAAKVNQVLPFAPRVDLPRREVEPTPEAVDPSPPILAAAPGEDAAPVAAPRPRAEVVAPLFGQFQPRRESRPWRIDWKRTAAASLALMLLESVAFATAYWFVRPAELGTLLVDSPQRGISVLIDGRESGVTPLSVQLKPGRYTLEMRGYGVTKVLPVEISAGVQTTQMVRWPRGARVGTLSIRTTPEGARIIVDGAYRGVAPLVLDDLTVGGHTVVAESPSGRVEHQVRVEENQLTDLDVGIFSGWLSVFAPVEVRVFEAGRLLGTSLDGKILIAPGPHELEIVNQQLGLREVRAILIEPGRDAAISVEVPDGAILIEAPNGTEVVVDGQSKGTTPLDAIAAPIGTREVLLRHPAIGQRRMTVTVTVDHPARVSLLAP
jgi:hypothetical protein